MSLPYPDVTLRELVTRSLRQVRVWSRTATFATTIAGICVLALAGIAFDGWIRLEDVSARIALSLAVVLLGGVWFGSRWTAGRRRRHDATALAREIEERAPATRGWLSSAVAFLHEPAPGHSQSLRERTIVEATRRLRETPQEKWLDLRTPRRLVAFASIVLVACGIVTLVGWETVSLGAIRLASPWMERPWPRATRLVLLSPPSRVVAGDTLSLRVAVQGRRPDDLRIEVRRTSLSTIESVPVAFGGDEAMARIATGDRDFYVRAVGGDDREMPWNKLVVVPRPAILSSSLVVHLPEYAGGGFEDTGLVVRALAAARLEWRATVDMPIVDARIVDEQGNAAPIDCLIAADGRSFSTPPDAQRPWRVGAGGRWTPEWVVADGLVGRGPRIDVRALSDALPTIELVAPELEAVATQRGVLRVAGAVIDDFPGASWRATARLDGRADLEFPLVATPIHDAVSSEVRPLSIGDSRAARGAFSWTADLARAEVAPGQRIEIRVQATDAAGQSAAEMVRSVAIVTDAEFDRRLESRLARVGERVAAAAERAARTRAVLAELEGAVGVRGQWSTARQERLERAAPDGGDLASRWNTPIDGLSDSTRSLASLAIDNRRQDSRVGLAAVELVRSSELALVEGVEPLGRELAAAVAAGEQVLAEESPDAIQRLRSHLEGAIAKADAILAALDPFLKGRTATQTASELIPALQALERLLGEWEAKLQNRLAAKLEGVAVESRALGQWEAFARDTRALWSKSLERFHQLEASASESPDPAAAMFRAARSARRWPIDGWLQEAGALSREDRPADAAKRAHDARDAVARILATLTDAPAARSEERTQEAARLRDQLQALSKMQSDLVKRLGAMARRADGSLDPARGASAQDEIRKRLDEIREQAAQDGSATRNALDEARARMVEASGHAANGKWSPAWMAAQSARARLEQAIDAVSDDEDAARAEAIAHTTQFVTAFALEAFARQKTVVEGLKDESTSRELSATAEKDLAAMTSEAARSATSAPALAAALTGIESALSLAARELPTEFPSGVKAARDALARLERLVLAVSIFSEESPSGASERTPPPAAGEKGDDRGTVAGPGAAELAWVKLEQESLRMRAAAWQSRRDAGEAESTLSDEAKSIAAAQRALVEIVATWMKPAASVAPSPREGTKVPTEASPKPGASTQDVEDGLFPPPKRSQTPKGPYRE